MVALWLSACASPRAPGDRPPQLPPRAGPSAAADLRPAGPAPTAAPDPRRAVEVRRLVAGARVDGLRAALHEAAQAPFFEAGPPAGRVLEAARDALALLEGAADDEALAGLGRAAAELRETGSASLERSDHVRAGLDHAVAALRAIPDRSIGGWITAAAEAVAAVDPAMPLGLQRARVQDALRSVADAVVVALERAAP